MTPPNRPFTLPRLELMYATAPASTFWRHDVDFSLDAALKMAIFEEKRGISATYYLVSAHDWPFYSSDEARGFAQDLLELGHRVGHHVDARRHLTKRIFERGHRPPVSFHCPTEHWLWRDLDWCENAYASRWKGHYWADSGGVFSFGDPEEAFPGRVAPMQVNLHPEWWFDRFWLDRIDFQTHEDYFYCKHPHDVDVEPSAYS